MADVFTVEGKVTLDTSGLNAGVEKASQAGKKLAGEVEQQTKSIKEMFQDAFSFSLGNTLSDLSRNAARYMLEFAKDSVSVASSLQEVQNVVDVTFGDAAKGIEQWATSTRTQFGLTELQAKQYASTMGAMLKSMGVGEEQVYDMSTAMAGLAADMASFYNISFDDAFAKLRAGISGETEPLKQLGINLNVANLEAYALSQGISTAYESMTLAEQAMLRYNYILNATADAQGDFARTSDSYANNMRLLETNINSLKASLGEAFLPVINDVVSAINGMFDNQQTLSQRMSAFDSSFEKSAASIATNDIRARSFIDTLEELSQKESLTAVEAAQWDAAARGLCEIYPELEGMIGDTTGTLNSSIEAIRGETAALKENALEKARVAALQGKLDAWAQQAVKVGEMQAEYDALYDVFIDLEGKRQELYKQVQSLPEDVSLANLSPEELQLVQDYANAEVAANEASAAAWNFGQALNEEKKQLADTETQLNKTQEALSGMGALLDSTGAATGGTEGGGDAFGFVENTDYAKAFDDALKDLQKEGEEVQKMFKEIEQYKLDNLNAIAKKIEGMYGTFDKAGKVKKTTAKKMLGGVDSQVEQLDRFAEAYKQLQEMGADDTLMSQFDFSPESIAQMEALIKSGADGVTTANEKVAELKTKQAEVAEMLAQTALNVDEQYKNMVTTATTANESMTSKMTSLKEAAATMSASVLGQTLLTALGITGVQTVGDALGLSEWEPELKAEDNATSVISAVEEALKLLDGKSATVTLNINKSGSLPDPDDFDGGKPHATGLDYVPYDDYVARLHKGEAVLTRAEANNWRKGGRASVGVQPMNVTVNVTGVAKNPYEIADEVRNALELMRWRA